MKAKPGIGRRLARVAAVLLVLAPMASRVAAGAVSLQWYQHYERGLALADQERWEEALAELDAAAEIEGRPRDRIRTYGREFVFGYDPDFHRARCLIELGRWEDARRHLEAARRAGVTPSDSLQVLSARLEEASGPVPKEAPTASTSPPERGRRTRRLDPAAAAEQGRVRIDSSPAGAMAVIDGRPLGRTPLAERSLVPGDHDLLLLAAGHEPWRERFTAIAGESLHLRIAMRPAPAQATSDLGPSTGASASEPPSRGVDPAPPPISGGDDGNEEARGPEPSESTAGGLVRPPAAEVPGELQPTSAPYPAESGAKADTPSLRAAAATLTVALLLAAVVVLRRRRRPSGRRLGGYEVFEELGRGGMATTFRGRRLADGLPVAVKVPHETGDPTYATRFVREGELGETLHHPGIVRIYESGTHGGRPFLAMELLAGRTLAREIQRHPDGVGTERSLRLVRDIAEALDYAHAKGIVHRDLKPENIMLLPDGGLKVMDFGVARVEGLPGLTSSRFFFGSPLYAAPEMVDPRAIDQRADLYSLGIVLFELLTGRQPFVDESVFRVLEMHRDRPLPSLEAAGGEIQGEVGDLVRRLTAKQPKDRYPSAQALLVDLQRLLTCAGGSTEPEPRSGDRASAAH